MIELKCWNCGIVLSDIPLPISRQANCPECFNELHCCRLCTNFDPSIAADQCAEERADPPVIKEGANFCEWFTPNPRAYRADTSTKRDVALERLDALFTDESTETNESAPAPDKPTENAQATPLSKEDEARAKLDRLFSTPKSPSEGPEDAT